MKKRVHLMISGKVQGVFFRANTQQKAQELNLCGWAKNVPTGEVEVYAVGEENALTELIEWCHMGPPRAQVAKVKIMWDQDLGDFSSFKVV